MRVLWVTAEPPHHAGWGGPIRQAYLLDALADAAEVHLLVAGHVDDPAVREAATAVTELEPMAQSPESALVRRVRTLVPSPPMEIRGSRAVRRLLHQGFGRVPLPDVVILQHGELGPLLWQDGSAGRRIIDLHHLLSVRHAHAAAATTGRERLHHLTEARRARRFEQDLVARADRVVVCSDEDATVLGGGHVVPNGVNLEQLRPSPLPASHSVVFTGHLGYPPNEDAVVWLATEIVPRLRAVVPEVKVSVVGRAPGAAVRARVDGTPGMCLIPDVRDMAPHLHSARVAVVPVRVGSGTRLKALDAMAAGRPVVGTTIGLEGLGIVHGVDALVADDPAAFSDAVARVLLDDALAERLGAGGRARAEQYGWAAVGRRWVEAVLG